ncbi:MAG: molybdenum cofactor guanylyltransferase [bacterium]
MLTGMILAGGKSTRMGRDKALLKVEGLTVIRRVADALSPCCSRLAVVCGPDDDYGFLGLPVIRDLEPGEGVFMGLYSGLCRMETERALVAGCDMPYIRTSLAAHLAELSESADIVVPRIRGNYEPLFATYSKACLAPARDLLDSGEKRIRKLYELVPTGVVEEEEIKRFDPDLSTFVNLNFPADLEKIEGNEK